MNEDDDPYRRLAEAIVDQAISDYLKCYRVIKSIKDKITKLESNKINAGNNLIISRIDKLIKKENAKISKQEKELQSIEAFFQSEWFTELTDRNPDTILRKLKDEVKKYDNTRIPKSAI